MKRYLTCECGFSIAASDLDDLVEAAKHHARQAHQMKLSADQLLAMTTNLDDDSRMGDGPAGHASSDPRQGRDADGDEPDPRRPVVR